MSFLTPQGWWQTWFAEHQTAETTGLIEPILFPTLGQTAELPTRNARVLQVVNGEHYAGAERVQDLLALRLPQERIDVQIACVKPGRFPYERLCQDTPLRSLPMSNRFDLRPAWHLARLIRQERIDLLHTHNARALLIAALAAIWTRTPIIHHVHGQTQVEVGGSPFTRANAWLEKKLLTRCAAIIAVSDSVARNIAAGGIDENKIFTIPNGVPAVKPITREMHEIPTVGFVAWLRPRKGLETLLESAALLLRAGRPCRLRIVGRFDDTEYEAKIQSLAGQLGLSDWIDWRGFRQPITNELQAMDLLAFPSILAEGMPMVVLEALAAGTPVIGSRVDGVTDVLRHEQNGWLVEPGDPVELAAAIHTLWTRNDLRRELSQTGCEEHARLYSDRAMARRTAQLYRRVLRDQASGS